MEFEEMQIPEIVEVKHLRLDKDGTYYQALAFKLKGSFCFGTLGCVTDGWLVIDHLNRKAYLFRSESYIDVTYIAEKLGDHHNPPSITDLRNMQALLHEITGYKGCVPKTS